MHVAALRGVIRRNGQFWSCGVLHCQRLGMRIGISAVVFDRPSPNNGVTACAVARCLLCAVHHLDILAVVCGRQH